VTPVTGPTAHLSGLGYVRLYAGSDLVKLGPVLVGAPLLVWSAVAALATRPRLAAMVFGESATATVDPLDFGLLADDVEYAPESRAWWIPTAEPPVGAAVIVHGFEPTDNPRATDPGPRLDLAVRLHRTGIASLVVNLGYASGAHPHTGGPSEADDIAAAVEWARQRSGVPVAIVGFSAGGHAAVVAAGQCQPSAVVTDASFVDFGDRKPAGVAIDRVLRRSVLHGSDDGPSPGRPRGVAG